MSKKKNKVILLFKHEILHYNMFRDLFKDVKQL